MISITEGKFIFTFPNNWEVIKYDESHFFLNHIRKSQGSKAVDVHNKESYTKKPLGWDVEG